MLDKTEMRWIAVALIAAIVVLAVAHAVLLMLGADASDVSNLDILGQLCAVALAALTGVHLAAGGG